MKNEKPEMLRSRLVKCILECIYEYTRVKFSIKFLNKEEKKTKKKMKIFQQKRLTVVRGLQE